MRKEYEITEEELEELLNACNSEPVMYLSGGLPMFNSRQANANRAWEKLGKIKGFKHMTVKPNGKGDRFFTAEEVI